MALGESQGESDADRGHPTVEGGFQSEPMAAAVDDTRGWAAITRALVYDPKLILMNQPFGALDVKTRPEFNIHTRRIYQLLGME